MHGACSQDDARGQTAPPVARWRSAGPFLLARLRGATGQYGRLAGNAQGDGRELLAICMVLRGRARWRDRDRSDSCEAGEVLLLDRADELVIAGDDGLDGIVLLLPHHYLLPVLGALPTPGVYRATGSFGAVRDLCECIVGTVGTPAGHDDLLVAALRHLAAAALAGIDRSDTLLTRRDSELLDRCLAAIDANPGEPLSSESLGRLLGCSRSSLYRAAAPLGGVAEMVMRRRLSNVRRMLHDPAERRSIAAIAQERGFAQPSQFSRQFKRMFGTTAGAVRASALSDAGSGADGRGEEKGGEDGGPALQHR